MAHTFFFIVFIISSHLSCVSTISFVPHSICTLNSWCNKGLRKDITTSAGSLNASRMKSFNRGAYHCSDNQSQPHSNCQVMLIRSKMVLLVHNNTINIRQTILSAQLFFQSSFPSNQHQLCSVQLSSLMIFRFNEVEVSFINYGASNKKCH